MKEHNNMFWIQDHQINIAKTAVMKTEVVLGNVDLLDMANTIMIIAEVAVMNKMMANLVDMKDIAGMKDMVEVVNMVNI